MAIVKCKPTSPGRRFVGSRSSIFLDLPQGAPYASGLRSKAKTGGRNIMAAIQPHVIVGRAKNTTVLGRFRRKRMAFSHRERIFEY